MKLKQRFNIYNHIHMYFKEYVMKIYEYIGLYVFQEQRSDRSKILINVQRTNTLDQLIKYTVLLTAINLDCISCNNTKYIDFLFSEDSSCSLHSKDMNLYEYYERRMEKDSYVLCHGIHLHENNQINCSIPDNEVEHRKLRVIRMNYFDLEKYKFTYIETLIEKSHASVIPIYLNRRIRMENFLVFKNSLVCEDFHPIFFFIKYTVFYEILGLLNHLNGYKYDNIRSIYRKIVEYGLLRPFSQEILDDNLNLKSIYLKNTKKSFYILLKVLFDECDFDIEIIKNRFYILEFKTLYCDVIETFEHNSLQLYLKDIFLALFGQMLHFKLKLLLWFLDFYDVTSVSIHIKDIDEDFYMQKLGTPYLNKEYLSTLKQVRSMNKTEFVPSLINLIHFGIQGLYCPATYQNSMIDLIGQNMRKVNKIFCGELNLPDIFQPMIRSFKLILPNLKELFLNGVNLDICIATELLESNIKHIEFHYCDFGIPDCNELLNFNSTGIFLPKKISITDCYLLPEVFEIVMNSKNIYCLVLKQIKNLPECFDQEFSLQPNLYESLTILKMYEINFSEKEFNFISNFTNLQKLDIKVPNNNNEPLSLDKFNLCSLSHSLVTLKVEGFENFTLKTIETLKYLQNLYIRDSTIMEFNLFDCFESKENLIHLDLFYTTIKDKQSLNLLSKCKNLAVLRLTHCLLKETEFGFLENANFRENITELYLKGNKINSLVLLKIFEYRKIELLSISLRETLQNVFSVFENCKFITTLKFLFIYDGILNEKDLKTIFSFTHLKYLILENCIIIEESSKVLNRLSDLPSLKLFKIADSTISCYDKNIIQSFYETVFSDRI
ncbi:hypothetical protein CWI36_0293p0020 [Hamiltosporidium magnivora]|uniref:Uncharacterized protein n=1 Tax=Hamiltosporidium magnivora TaxID=148818 RepID=A0A4Q9LII3_9MICR|nr:hypothetical protein CWI36_0293p0020 [Hamiltosporidium magnivora]